MYKLEFRFVNLIEIYTILDILNDFSPGEHIIKVF